MQPAAAVAQVLDLKNKVVAASAPLHPPVRWIAAAGAACIDIGAVPRLSAGRGRVGMGRRAGAARPCCARADPPRPPTCHAGDASGGVTRLVEKRFSEKLEGLFKSRSYQLAVAVAETEQVGSGSVWRAQGQWWRAQGQPVEDGAGQPAGRCFVTSASGPTERLCPALACCSRCRLQVGGATLAGIHRHFGDFLYSKRDYDAAMEQ